MYKLPVAAAIALGALLISAPLQAGNGEVQKDGKCFYPAAGQNRDLRFGSWRECPETAASTGGTASSTPGSAVPGLGGRKRY
jgi:hypothetical protein